MEHHLPPYMSQYTAEIEGDYITHDNSLSPPEGGIIGYITHVTYLCPPKADRGGVIGSIDKKNDGG